MLVVLAYKAALQLRLSCRPDRFHHVLAGALARPTSRTPVVAAGGSTH